MSNDSNVQIAVIRHDERLKNIEARLSDMESHQNTWLVECQRMSGEFEYTKQDFIRLRKKQMDLEQNTTELRTLIIQIKYVVIGAAIMVVITKVGLSEVLTKLIGF